MLKCLQIQNYRAFEKLEIERLSRINLIAGRNNSGKSSLLEALFLLSGAGNPEMMLNANVIRGGENVMGSSQVIQETFWKSLFSTLDVNRAIEIAGDHRLLGRLVLNIAMNRADSIEIPLVDPSRVSMAQLPENVELSLSFRGGSNGKTEGRIRTMGHGYHIEQPASPRREWNDKSSTAIQMMPVVRFDRHKSALPFQSIFLSSHVGNVYEDAIRLGQLRRRKQGDQVVESLRIFEPKLQSIEDNTASGTPMIWGDIGLPELVPLSVMGGGMAHIVRLVLAISAVPGGVVLVDEVENGLHHAILQKVWRAVAGTAKRFDTQIVATTHSFECVEAAHQELDAGEFLLKFRGSYCRVG